MDVILLPNWIENVLTVKGETEDLLMFLDKHLIGSWFKFDTVIPQPHYNTNHAGLQVLIR